MEPTAEASANAIVGLTSDAHSTRELAELRTLGKLILFADDNVMIHQKYSHELFEAMVPLKKHWVGQASLAALHRVENIEVMARSGCRALFIGFVVWGDVPTISLLVGSAIVVATGLFLFLREARLQRGLHLRQPAPNKAG